MINDWITRKKGKNKSKKKMKKILQIFDILKFFMET